MGGQSNHQDEMPECDIRAPSRPTEGAEAREEGPDGALCVHVCLCVCVCVCVEKRRRRLEGRDHCKRIQSCQRNKLTWRLAAVLRRPCSSASVFRVRS